MIRRESVFSNRQRKRSYAGIRLFPAAITLLVTTHSLAAPEETDKTAVETIPEVEDASNTRIVVISSLSEQIDIHAIERTIIAQLADLDIDIDFHHVATMPPIIEAQDGLATTLMAAHGAVAAFIIYSGEARGLRILLQKEGRLEAMNREVDVAPGAPLHEALGVIVRAAVIAIIERKRTGHQETASSPIEASTKETITSDSPSTSSKPEEKDEMQRLYVEVGAQLGFFSNDILPWLGMAVGLGWQPIRHWHFHIGYVAFSQVTKSDYDLTLTLKRHPFLLGVGYFRPLRRFWWGGGISLGIDYITESIASQNEALTLSPESAEVYLAIRSYLYLGIRILDPLSLFLNLGAEIPLDSTKYGIVKSEGEDFFLKPFPVQPVMTLGLRLFFY